LNYAVGVAEAALVCAFLIFLGVLAFGAVAVAAFDSFPIFILD
jgi:hypothetical protein